MEKCYEDMKQELEFVSNLHTKQNYQKKVHGERILFPSSGDNLESVIYRYSSDSPTVFAAFGGGFIMGGCALDDHMWTTISHEAHVNIISIGYRRTPRYQFPVALNDVYHAVDWFCSHKERYNINIQKTVLMGASAGGNLATAATLLDRRMRTNYIKLLILNYPYLDLATDSEIKGHIGDEIYSYRIFPELYSDPEERKTPMVSPLYASEKELKKLPPVYITTAGNDVLRREGEEFAQKIRRAGGMVQIQNAADMPHGYLETWFNITDTDNDPEKIFFPNDLKLLYENGRLQTEVNKTCTFIKKAIKETFGD